MLPKLAFTSFASKYRAPKLEEGFKDIITVDFEVEFNNSGEVLKASVPFSR